MSRLVKLAGAYRTHFLKDLPKIRSLPQKVTVTGYISRSTKLFTNLKCPESGDSHELQIHTPENLYSAVISNCPVCRGSPWPFKNDFWKIWDKILKEEAMDFFVLNFQHSGL